MSSSRASRRHPHHRSQRIRSGSWTARMPARKAALMMVTLTSKSRQFCKTQGPMFRLLWSRPRRSVHVHSKPLVATSLPEIPLGRW